MVQLSLDGRRLHVSNSLYSTWDNQFYPGLRSWLLRVNCNPDGGMELDPDFFVDLNERPGGPARAHEVRLQGGGRASLGVGARGRCHRAVGRQSFRR
jgi:selenium-binding protein 1